MPLEIPEAMNEEHEELHAQLTRATKMSGKVGTAAKEVAAVLHPHFEKENELALPVVGLAREIAESKVAADSAKALEQCDKFRLEYEKMLQEHAEIVKTLDKLESVARKAGKRSVVEFAQKLRTHAKIEEDLTYPAVLMVGKLLRQT